MTNIGSSLLSADIPLCDDDDLLCAFPNITQDWDEDDQEQPVSPFSSDLGAELAINQVSTMDSSRSSLTLSTTTQPCDVDPWKMDSVSIEPTPINPFGSIHVVKKVDLADNHMPHALFSNLSEIFDFSLFPQEKEQDPSLAVSDPIASHVPSTIMFPAPLKKKATNNTGSSITRSVSTSSTSSVSSGDKKNSSDRWYDRFEDLKVFVQEHGHCHVPINYTPNMALSQWIKRQRYQWKLKQDGKSSSLTYEREQKLEDIGFLWDVRHVIWDTRYHELVKFHKKYGHCNVSIGYEDHPKLGTWVKCQRRQYRLMMTGQKSHMTPLRVQQLNELDFVWKGKTAGRK